MRVGGQRHAPAALPPARIQYPLYRRLGGPQGRSGRVQFDSGEMYQYFSAYSEFVKNLRKTYFKFPVSYFLLVSH